MTDFTSDPLVGTAWLADNLSRADVKVVDASFYLPAEERDAKAEYAAARIPGAVFFDIDEIADRSIPLPHMFPSAEDFAAAVGRLGIGDGDTVVTYDGGKLTGAGRAWWMFRAFGHDRVAVLDGGIGKWRAEGRPTESGAPPSPAPARFTARFRPKLVRNAEDMLRLVEAPAEQILDARSTGRFAGTAPEPRAGLRSGHMPGARNLPYDRLLNEDGTLKDAEALRALFAEAGIDLDRPVVTSCGSGVSATVPLLALLRLGHRAGALYDGSWAEWGSRQDTPIVT